MELKENDIVYTDYGYGVVVTPPIKTQSSTIYSIHSYCNSLGFYVIGSHTDNSTNVPIKEESRVASQKDDQTTEGEVRTVSEGKPIENLRDYSPSLTKVQLRWGGYVFVEERLIRKKIKLNIKTFYGSKKKITIEVDITATIETIRNLLLSQHLENEKTLYNLRLIYPMGTIQELNLNNSTVEQLRLPDGANLVLLVQTTFTWDPNYKGSDIKLTNGNLTASKMGEVDYQFLLGSLQMTSGRHYWEVKVDKYGDEEDLFIGVSRKEINLNIRPLDSEMFWGYMCLCAKKVGADGALFDYGYQAKLGDVIGVLLEYKSGVATLSFYRNGAKCGVAFTNLTGSFVPAVCMNYGDIQVTLDPKATPPYS